MTRLEALAAMLARGQDNALLRYGLGAAYFERQRFEQAAEHLRRAVAHDAGYSAAWKLLAQALAEAGRCDDAIAAYQQGIRAAEAAGDIQAAKTMNVFLARLRVPGGAGGASGKDPVRPADGS